MYANRISRFLNRMDGLDLEKQSSASPAQGGQVPAGFVPLPTDLIANGSQHSLESLYKMAYEAAQAAARLREQ